MNLKLQLQISELASESLGSWDNILDSEIDEEEVEFAIHRLKSNRAGGADNISPELSQHSGSGSVTSTLASASRNTFLKVLRMMLLSQFSRERRRTLC